ncbi:MAG: DUF11 domain-containing protein [Anaerolineales bacterium]|nr:DUF11 domain-containing protein [Anaerolineales bacterium]
MKNINLAPNLKAILVLILIILFMGIGHEVPPVSAAGPWYVKPGGDDLADCLSPATACATINGAIGKASTGETINVAEGTYTGSGTEVVLIDKDLTLSGGWDTTFSTQSGDSMIDGESARRAIAVHTPTSATIDKFVLQNGSYTHGGALGSSGTVTISDSTIHSSEATSTMGGGIYNTGTMTVNNCEIYDNTSKYGGGIGNRDTITINDSQIYDNTATGTPSDNFGAGGIYTEGGVVNLVNSSITNNKADTRLGGGIYSNVGSVRLTNSSVSGNSAQTAGGIYKTGGAIALINSTISENTAANGGGIYHWNSTTNIYSSTISDNAATSKGGGIYISGGTVNLKNSILSGNSANTGAECYGVLTSVGYNLFGDTTDCTLTPTTGDQTGTDPQLGPLIGSPAYHPLHPSSPAVNAGDPAGCTDHTGTPLTTDQRGVARDGSCDIGSYEYVTPGAPDSILAVAGSSQRTPPLFEFDEVLQAMVLDNVGTPVNSVLVTFTAPSSGASGTFEDSGTDTTSATTDELGIATASTFTANDQFGSYSVNANYSGGPSPAEFTLSNLAWYVSTDGNDSNDCLSPTTECETIQGALGKALSKDKIFIGIGTFTPPGGQGYSISKDISLLGGWNEAFTSQDGRTTIDGEDSKRGINIENGLSVVIENFTIQNCDSNDFGGGIKNGSRSDLTLSNSIIRDNYASSGGGAISTGSGTLTIYNSSIVGNSVYGGGGAISTFGGTTILNNSVVRDNYAFQWGGAFNNNCANLYINNSTISGNSTDSGGGGILHSCTGYTLSVNSSTISDNTSMGSEGGGIRALGDGAIMQNTILDGNYSPHGGSDCAGNITSLGYNLVGDSSGCTITTSTGDQIDVDPILGPLVGSPGHHPIAATSPAVEGGNPGGCTEHDGDLITHDQRGIARTGVCDIGSYEYIPPGSPDSLEILSGTPQRVAPGNPFADPFELVVIDVVGSPVPGESVHFQAPTTGASGTFADSGNPDTTAVTDDVGVATSSAFTANDVLGSYTVEASVVGVPESVYFELTNVVWYVSTDGNDGNDCQSSTTECASINGVLIKPGFTEGDRVLVGSGTYYGTGTEVVLLDTGVELLGGWNSGFNTQDDYSVLDGESSRRPLTINADVTTSLERFTFQNGSASGGGGLKNLGSASLQNVRVVNNYSSSYGGGVRNDGTLEIVNCEMSGNSAYTQGGAVDNDQTLSLDNCQITYNSANNSGGGIYNEHGDQSIIDSIIAHNTASSGGGIYNGDFTTLEIVNSAITSNDANNGGGITDSRGTTSITNTSITDNHATSNGGGIYKDRDTLTLHNVTIANNTASVGGGIYNHSDFMGTGTITLENSILADNFSSSSSPDCDGEVSSLGYSLVENTAGCTFTSGVGDLLGIDPRFGPLEISQGYLPLSLDSPAIDAGNPAGCLDHDGVTIVSDQRGAPRVDRCDIGAIEYQNLDASRKTADILSGPPGASVTYIITLENTSDSPATGVTLTDTLQSELNYEIGSLTATSGSYEYLDGVISWNGSVGPNSMEQVQFTATIDLNTAWETQVVNTAIINSGGVDIHRSVSITVGGSICDFSKYGGNPVLSVGAPGSWDEEGVWDPTILKQGSTHMLWYIGADASWTRQIGLAISPDGEIWTKEGSNPVLSPTEPWEGTALGGPSVIFDGGLFKMWYMAFDSSGVGRIGYATSPDGITWTKYGGNPVLDTGTTGSWESDDVTTPTVIKEGSTYHMWYGGYDGGAFRIGHATSSDGINWTKDGSNPVLDVGPGGEWDWLSVYSPSVIKVGDEYQLMYSGKTLPLSWQSGYATSSNGVDWNRETILIPEGAPGTFDSGGADHVTQALSGPNVNLWYAGTDDSGTYSIGYAQAELCSEGSHRVYLPLLMKSYPSVPPCDPYYTDDFSDPSSGWPISDDAFAKFDYVGGEYQVWIKVPDTGWLITPGAMASDFTASVSARRLAGTDGPYGMIFAISPDWDEYVQAIIDDNWFSMWKYDSGFWGALCSWQQSAHIQTGTNWNRMKVVRDGSSIDYYVNGHLLCTGYLPDFYGFRGIGVLAVAPVSNALEFRFDDFMLYDPSCGESATFAGIPMGEPAIHPIPSPPPRD